VLTGSVWQSRSWENYVIGAVGTVVGTFIGGVLILGADTWGWIALGVATILGCLAVSLAHATAIVRVETAAITLRWLPPTKQIPLGDVQGVTLGRVGITTRCPILVLRDGSQVKVVALVSYPHTAEARRQLLTAAIDRARAGGR
jgi:hypothetical protein